MSACSSFTGTSSIFFFSGGQGQRFQVEFLVAGNDGHYNSVAVFTAGWASDQRFEDLLGGQADLGGHRFGGQVFGIDFVGAQFVMDAELIEQPGGVGFRRHFKRPQFLEATVTLYSVPTSF